MLAVILATLLAQTLAQTPNISVTVEPRVESLRYRFENPSSFDTVELVPHFFEQTYDTDNVWLGLRARYRLLNRAAETQAAFTPQVTAQADDIDTFFQSDGDVVVSGTIGTASLRAWEVGQRVVVGASGNIQYGLGYSYRRDSARYHDGTRITRRSSPPSEIRELVTTREFVASQVHQAVWFARWSAGADRPFSMLFEASPFTLGRLAIELPDKYPGRTIVFRSRAAVLAGEAAFRWPMASMNVELAARASRSFSYSRGAAMRLGGASLVLRVGTR
ncbi:MAG TPA: hypothetical protein VJ813_20235 [Vicinamibacterales bacterium]|nr:hypothetical protein [Vicinamibacterales bacterium]